MSPKTQRFAICRELPCSARHLDTLLRKSTRPIQPGTRKFEYTRPRKLRLLTRHCRTNGIICNPLETNDRRTAHSTLL